MSSSSVRLIWIINRLSRPHSWWHFSVFLKNMTYINTRLYPFEIWVSTKTIIFAFQSHGRRELVKAKARGAKFGPKQGRTEQPLVEQYERSILRPCWPTCFKDGIWPRRKRLQVVFGEGPLKHNGEAVREGQLRKWSKSGIYGKFPSFLAVPNWFLTRV